ncbi:MAG: copper-binding protein [Thermoanaerobaculia bacterium]
MTKKSLLISLLILVAATIVACNREQKPPENEKTYPMVGVIVGRTPQSNELIIQHEKIEGLMEGMTMPFRVEGADVKDLPPDGSKIHATLHKTDRAIWVSDVQKVQK